MVLDELAILDFNAVCNKAAQENLDFHGDHTIRILSVLKLMNEQQIKRTGRPYDLISVHEISYKALQLLEPFMLNVYGYRLIYGDPLYWKSLRHKNRYTCLTVVFLRNTIPYTHTFGYFGFTTVLRYCWIKVPVKGYYITIRTSHVPCCSDDSKTHLKEQIDRKKRMLQAEVSFQKEMVDQKSLAVSIGDFNGDANEDCYCKDLYKEFAFRDLITEPTFGNKHLDHVFVSDFSTSKLSVEANVLPDMYLKVTDHKMIDINIK